MLNSNINIFLKIKILVFIGIIFFIITANITSYATIRGDADNDVDITAYDAYCVLKESIEDPPDGGYPESTLQLIDMDCDTDISAYDAYSILKKSVADTPINYTTPEDYGAVGDGITDDTAAFQQCLNSNIPNVILTGEYLINDRVTTSKEKHFYNGKIILGGSETFRAFTFTNTVSFTDTIFTCSRDEIGEAAHYQSQGEMFEHCSNTFFVNVWGDDNSFEGCVFHNAITAIRGMISTGQGAEAVPQNLHVNHCRFTECKMPIQGFFAYANIDNSSFRNDSDLYSGEHCIYLNTLGAVELNIRGCLVETYNTNSGAAFQIYGKANAGEITTPPTINVENCRVYANGVVSSDLANVFARNVNFEAQHENWNTFSIEGGSLVIDSGYYNHTYFISAKTYRGGVKPTASNATFRIKREVNSFNSRGYFPYSSSNCTFINWGGTAVLSNTRIEDCIFTRDISYVVGKYYLSVDSTASLYVEDSAFKAGDFLAANATGYLELKNCHYVNTMGQNVTNYQEIGTIHEDIVD